MKKQLIQFYLDFVNDFLTIQYFADYYNITVSEAETLIKIGKKYHERQVELYKIKNHAQTR